MGSWKKFVLWIWIYPAMIQAQDKLTLDQVVAEALEKNASLLAERANISIAEARIYTARLRPNPVLSVSANHLDLLGSGFNDLNAGGPSELTVHTDFVWERGGKRQSRMEVAQSAKSVSEWQFLDVLRLAILEIENIFVDLLLARETLALAEQNAASFNQIVRINAVRLQAGDIAQVEYIRSQLAALQFENSVQQSRLRLNQAATRLQTMMGREAFSPSFEVVGALRTDPVLPTLGEIEKMAWEQRPDWLARTADQKRAEAEYRSQLAQSKVDLTFGAEYTRQQVNAKSNSLGFTVEAPLPFFNRNQGEIARAGEERKQSVWRRASLTATIRGELAAAYQQASAAKALLEVVNTQMLQKAREVRGITEFSYKQGAATLLELLDAQRAFNETMQTYNEARAEYARSLFLLDAAVGKVRTR